LDKALTESDWWEEENDGSSDDESVGESTISKSSFSSKEISPGSAPPPLKERKFCNKGLQTWNQGRQAWRDEGRTHFDAKNKAKPIPAAFQKELVKCLGDRRQFELSQRIPLRDMIEAYTIVWSGPDGL